MTGRPSRSEPRSARSAEVARKRPRISSTNTSTSSAEIASFRAAILGHWKEKARDLPWRRTRDPYAILVSEFMLQQTQVPRVVPKYLAWLEAFPSVASLAAAPLSDLLSAWSGLGYNRRAKWLRESAVAIMRKHGGRVPSDPEELDELPGVGPYTARAISTFAFGLPQVFIETNIRRVFIHFFFQDRPEDKPVADAEILPLIELSLDREDPRSWYWALMDYGSELPRAIANPNRKSASYAIQSPLKGSLREARGAILRILTSGAKSWPALVAESGIEEERMEKAVRALEDEGLVSRKGRRLELG